ncbi:hypothetical protein B0H21DRAFT_776385 [Amylocystis lapponica]|nr:hypothetical protein B0H21DRAFT_776385 [Amylocystis lapponica]
MANLNNLLNPESSYEYNMRIQKSRSPSSSTSSSTGIGSETPAPSPPSYCPNTLTCLQDTNNRPQHTLPVILRCAILGSPKKRLTIREIYAAMERKYPYYKTAGPAWKQSVRHHLSLNRLFERQPRPPTDPGFGSYWTVNLDAPPGTKRPRKRGRPSKEAQDDVDTTVSGSPPDLRRPRRSQEKMPERALQPVATLRPVDDRSFKQGSSMQTSVEDEEDEEEEMEWEGSGDGSHASDEDYSEDDVPLRFDARVASSSTSSAPRSAPPQQPSRSVLHGAFSSYSAVEHPDVVVERLQKELATVRRNSADAVSASVKLTSQLAEAQGEVMRIKSVLKVAERRLEEENRRRLDAERAADEEAQLRLAAEDQLRAYQSRRRPPGYSSSRS